MATTTSAWTETLDLWWQTLLPSVAPDSYQVLKKFLEQGKHYFRFNEEFLKSFQTLAQQPTSSPDDWQTLWEQSCSSLKEQFLATTQEYSSFSTFPLEHWQTFVASFFAIPKELLAHFNVAALDPTSPQFADKLKPLLTLANAKYAQEWQKQIYTLLQLATRYQKAQEAYVASLNQITYQTVELFKKRMLELSAHEPSIDSLRTVYDQWVNCGEEVYTQVASTPEFGTVYAELLNSFLAFQHSRQQWLDSGLAQLNIPTHQELNTMNKRLHQMRRDWRKLQESLPQIQHLQAQIDSLQSELAILKAASTQVTKKSSPKKIIPPSPGK